MIEWPGLWPAPIIHPQIQKLCIDHHFTLIVCWTSDEAAAYVTAFRKYASGGLPPHSICPVTHDVLHTLSSSG